MKLKRLSLFLALVMIISAFAGTFTFASAATAGGSFEIWREGAKVEEYTGTIAQAVAASKIEDGDTIKLTSNYISKAVDQSITMNLTIDGQGYTVTNNVSGASGRLFNVGGPGTNTTGIITVTFKNMTMYSTTSLIQINSVGGTVIFDDVDMTATGNTNILIMTKADSTITLQNGSTLLTTGHNWIKDTDSETDGNQNSDDYGVFHMGAANDVVNIVNSTVTIAAPVFAVAKSLAANQVVTFDGATMISAGFKGRDTWVHGFVYQNKDDTNLTVNCKGGSVFDGRQNEWFRLMYLRKGSTLNIEDSVFYGSDNSHDIMQVNSGTTVNLKQNVVFVGGGTNGTGKKIIRNYSGDVYYDSTKDSFNWMKIVNRSAGYATDAAMLQGVFGVPAISGTNYDEVAAAMGYLVRVGTAEEAYANGTFAGYYPSWTDAASGRGAKATTITLLGNAFWRTRTDISAEWTVDLNGYTLSNMDSYVRFSNMTASLTIKNGTIKGFAGNGNMFQMQNVEAAQGISLTFENVKFDLAGSGTTGLIFPLGQRQSVNFKGNTTVVANHAIHTLVNMYASNVSVNISDGEFTAINFSRVAYGEKSNHDGSGAITGLTLKVTNAVLRTDAWGGVFENKSGTAVVTLDNADIMMPASAINQDNGKFETQFLRLSAGASATVNGETITAEEETYYMPASKMLTGASVRIAKGATAENMTESGIRFESTLSSELIASVQGLIESGVITDCKIGTVVFKKSDLGSKSVAQLVRDANADANDALIVADIEAKDGIVENEDGSATIRAAIINIKEKNYGVEFGAVAYLEYKLANGETVRIYGNYNATNNTRSIKAVAEAALADYKTEAGVVDGYNYYNEITVEIEGVETTVYSCYSDEQIAILNTYAGK